MSFDSQPLNIKRRDIDMVSLGKSLGQIEVATKNFQEVLKEEKNNRAILEKKTQKMAEDFSKELSEMRTGIDIISANFSQGLEKMKSTILEDVDFKTTSIMKIVKDSMIKSNNYESSELDYSNFEIFRNQIENRFKKIEKAISIPSPNRDTEINTGLAKINFFEKQMNSNIKKMNDKIEQISNQVLNLSNEIEILKKSKNDFNNMFDHFQRDFISTNSNNLKFNYKTNMLLSEMKDKLSSYDKSIDEQTDTLNNIKTECFTEIGKMKKYLETNINNYHEELTKINKELYQNQENFTAEILGKNEKFVNFISTQMENLNQQVIENQRETQNIINQMQSVQNEFSQKLKVSQKQFFHNLNEVEEMMMKKYENIYKIIDLKKN